MLAYPITLTEDGDTIMATCKDFPELTTFGDDYDDALLHAVDAVEEAIAARIAKRQPVAQPSRGKYKIFLPTQTTLKVLIYQAMGEMGVKKAQLAKRLSWHGPQVDRLLNIHHSTRLDHIDEALAALNKRSEISIVDDV